jgi:hypothetical protein
MRPTVRRRVIAAIGTATFGCAGPAATAAAHPTYCNPESGPCDHLFRAPQEAPRRGHGVLELFRKHRNRVLRQRNRSRGLLSAPPLRRWRDMNELAPGRFFYGLFTPGIPDAAHLR